MILFNQTDNAISSITTFTNEDSSYPKENLLTSYTKQVAKSTTTTTMIDFTFTGRDLAILNTNATSGTIYADKPSSASCTVTSGNVTYSADTYIENCLTVSSGDVATVNNGIILGITEDAVYTNDAITFTANNLKKTDLYFDMGSEGTWTVQITLNVSSGTVEVGSVIGGLFTQYGVTVQHNKLETELSANVEYVSKVSNYDALKAEIINDDDFVVIPSRNLDGIWLAYGKISLKEASYTSKNYDGEIATNVKAEIL